MSNLVKRILLLIILQIVVLGTSYILYLFGLNLTLQDVYVYPYMFITAIWLSRGFKDD